MIIRVLDFETTGFPPNAGVCEAGWTDVQVEDDGFISIGETVSKLCFPGLPINPNAQAVHGISDEMVRDAPPAALVFREVMEGADVFCAHNAEFEKNFFGGGEKPWICTYKVALALFPRFPTHKNGDLPGHLGIDLDPARCAPLHRAGPDTYVTAMILRHMLGQMNPAQMIDISAGPKRLARMPFGKLKGTLLSEMTPAQLRSEIGWITRAPDVVDALKAELKRRGA